jgi:hypothetical protein
MPTDRELDHLIDAALSSYSATDPRPDLEQRILGHALAEPQHGRSPAWAWVFALPTAACLFAFLFFAGHRDSHRSTLEATARTVPAMVAGSPHETPPTSAHPTPRMRSISHIRSTRPAAVPEVLPKEDVFPSPSPLTAEERAAIALTREPARMPQQSNTAEIEISPIHIAELQIKPIAPPGDLLGSPATESFPEAQQP